VKKFGSLDGTFRWHLGLSISHVTPPIARNRSLALSKVNRGNRGS